MKKVLFASVALAALAVSPAFAADPGMPMEEAPMGFSWTGGYVGLFAGGGWGNVDVEDVDSYNGPPQFGYRDAGFLGGVYGGYNWQAGQIVYGVEAELGYLGLKDSKQYPPYVGVRTPQDSVAAVDTDFYAAATARVGYAFDNVLVYAKGGVAGLNTEVSYTDTDPTGTTLVSGTSKSKFKAGYTVGGGVEVALTPQWTVKAEYMYADFGNISHTAESATGVSWRFKHDLDVHTAKIGFAYKF